ncbi:MAG: ferritin-like domain-containing protein [Chloroflexia bacterium]
MAKNANNQDDQIKDKLIPHIQNAYAMENQLAETLEKHVDQTADFPDVQQMISNHLEQTKQHRSRMEERLNFYGERPSGVKDLGSSFMGNMMGAMAGARPDMLARIARDEYITEHLEIAGYTLLITTAQAFGDIDTVRAADQNLRDEIAMQSWLLQHMPEVCLRSLEAEGWQVPDNAWQWVQQSMNATTSGSAWGDGQDGSQYGGRYSTGSTMGSTTTG